MWFFVFCCNDVQLLSNRLWRYDKRNQDWVLRNNIMTGIGFETAMYTIAAKQCLWFNGKAGYNVTEIEDRINGSIAYLINRFGMNVNNSYQLKAPLFDTWSVDNGIGAPVMDTANVLISMTLFNDSLRQIYLNPKWQTKIQVVYVDYPNVMVRYARMIQNMTLQFEIVNAIAIIKPTTIIVEIDSSCQGVQSIVLNGNSLDPSQWSLQNHQISINITVNMSDAYLFQVVAI